MRRTVKKMAALLLGFALICTITACTSGNSEAVGQWYNSRGKCLDIRDDGSWKLEDSYGTGTWKKLSDGSFEFIDFYGDTQNTLISEDEWGKYIDFGYYGDFYKDEYPPEMGTEEDIEESMEDTSEIEMNTPTEIDPFENLSYEVYGISPYCEITLNNSACSEEVQKYVTYTLDKETYANGETAVITAVLSEKTGEESYVLKNEETTYDISEQPEYTESLEQIDTKFLENEVNDTITSLIASSIGTNEICDVSDMDILDYESRLSDANLYIRNGITAVTSDYEAAYFSCIKEQKKSSVGTTLPYNRYSFIYCFNVSGDVNDVICEGKLYVNISAENIICSSDGSMTWGNENCNFEVLATVDGLDNCIDTTIMSNSDAYNISKIEE